MAYTNFVEHLQKLANLETSIALLHWDKEVFLPRHGAAARSQQVATLSGMAYDMATDEKFGKLLEELQANDKLSEDERRNVELVAKDYNRDKKLDKAFIIKRSNATSKGYHAWREAREKNDFEVFKPALAEMIALKKEEAEKLGYEDHAYDAMLEYYEPGAKTKELVELFADIREKLVVLTSKIRKKAPVENSFLYQHYPYQLQWDWGLELLENMGYDFERGRQDVSPHPFTISFNPNDVRITTRVDEQNLETMAWSCIHEGGHALYEQGLNADNFGLPLGRAVSLSIHESQSRLWENNVGRSIDYWTAHYPKLQARFPEQLMDVSLEQFYKGINKIEPSLIRIESDELHYHLHILIRFELEKALMENSLKVDDLKDAWNAKYKEYLDVDVPDDNQGCLQDIHWAHGSIGYFPTYSLGSFYAAQFFHQAGKDIKGLDAAIRKGNNQPLLEWLQQNIHQHGKKYSAKELCTHITGEQLSVKYFMDYAEKKFGEIYDL